MRKQEQKFYRGWLVAATATLGLAFSFPSIAIVTFSAFIAPLQQHFGWHIVEISLAISFCTIATILSSPGIGALIDKFGVKKIILISTVLLGLLLLAMGLLIKNLYLFYAAYFLIPILGGGAAGIGYSRIIVNWFSRRQGAALGLALAGVGIGAIVTPPFAQFFISTFNWQTAYIALGAPLILICFPAVMAFLREQPTAQEKQDSGEFSASASHKQGEEEEQSVALSVAAKTRQFRLLLAFFFLTGIVITGTIAHYIPLLSSHGLAASHAALVMALMGVTLIIGRIASGWGMDEFSAPHVVALFMAGPMIGLLLLWQAASIPMAITATLLFGLGAGAEMAIMGFFVRWYFGLKDFGKIYGIMFAAYNLGSAIGVPMVGLALQKYGNYDAALLIMSLLMLASCMVALRLPVQARATTAGAV